MQYVGLRSDPLDLTFFSTSSIPTSKNCRTLCIYYTLTLYSLYLLLCGAYIVMKIIVEVVDN
jgi:hypothetical protein